VSAASQSDHQGSEAHADFDPIAQLFKNLFTDRRQMSASRPDGFSPNIKSARLARSH
jgi:hypothetical protein